MSGFWGAIVATFGMGVGYFIFAIPFGVGLKLHPAAAAASAWAGYTSIAAAMLLIGEPARKWVVKRLKISPEPDPRKLFWRVWGKFGMPGLGLLAPVTVGPYFAALLAIALGEKPARVMLWIAGGVIPWCILFAVLSALGLSFWPK